MEFTGSKSDMFESAVQNGNSQVNGTQTRKLEGSGEVPLCESAVYTEKQVWSQRWPSPEKPLPIPLLAVGLEKDYAVEELLVGGEKVKLRNFTDEQSRAICEYYLKDHVLSEGEYVYNVMGTYHGPNAHSTSHSYQVREHKGMLYENLTMINEKEAKEGISFLWAADEETDFQPPREAGDARVIPCSDSPLWLQKKKLKGVPSNTGDMNTPLPGFWVGRIPTAKDEHLIEYPLGHTMERSKFGGLISLKEGHHYGMARFTDAPVSNNRGNLLWRVRHPRQYGAEQCWEKACSMGRIGVCEAQELMSEAPVETPNFAIPCGAYADVNVVVKHPRTTSMKRAYSLCDLHLLRKYIWLLLLLCIIEAPCASAQEISASVLDPISWSLNLLILSCILIVLSVAFSIFRVGNEAADFLKEGRLTMAVLRPKLLEFMDVSVASMKEVVGALKDFLWWQKVQTVSSMAALLLFPLIFGLSGLAGAPVAAAMGPRFRPEGGFRTRLQGWMKWLLLFVGAGAVVEAACVGPDKARHGLFSWIPFLRESGYFVWMCSHVKRVFSNFFKGKPWSDGFENYPNGVKDPKNPNDVSSHRTGDSHGHGPVWTGRPKDDEPEYTKEKYEKTKASRIEKLIDTETYIAMLEKQKKQDSAPYRQAVAIKKRLEQEIADLEEHWAKETVKARHDLDSKPKSSGTEKDAAPDEPEFDLAGLDIRGSDGFHHLPSQFELSKIPFHLLLEKLRESFATDTSLYAERIRAGSCPEEVFDEVAGQFVEVVCMPCNKLVPENFKEVVERLDKNLPREVDRLQSMRNSRFGTSHLTLSLFIAMLRKHLADAGEPIWPTDPSASVINPARFSNLCFWQWVSFLRVAFGGNLRRVVRSFADRDPWSVCWPVWRMIASELELFRNEDGHEKWSDLTRFATFELSQAQKLHLATETLEKSEHPGLGSDYQQMITDAQTEVTKVIVIVWDKITGEPIEVDARFLKHVLANGYSERRPSPEVTKELSPQGLENVTTPVAVELSRVFMRNNRWENKERFDTFLKNRAAEPGTLEKLWHRCQYWCGSREKDADFELFDYWKIAGVISTAAVGVFTAAFLASYYYEPLEQEEFVEEARSHTARKQNLKTRRAADTPVPTRNKFGDHSGGVEVRDGDIMRDRMEQFESPFAREFHPQGVNQDFAAELRNFASEIPQKYKEVSAADQVAVQKRLEEIAAKIELTPEHRTSTGLRQYAQNLRSWSSDMGGAIRATGDALKATHIQTALLDIAGVIEGDAPLPEHMTRPVPKPHPPAEKVAGVRQKVRTITRRRGQSQVISKWVPESALGKTKLNMSNLDQRLFKLSVADEGLLLVSNRLANAWLVGNKLVTTWHTIKDLCGDQLGANTWKCKGKFKACNNKLAFEKALCVGKLPGHPDNDDLGFLQVSVPVRLDSVPLGAPVNGDQVILVAWDDFDDKVPSVSTGTMSANGLHTCASIDGNCGGVLVSAITGQILGFHNAGGNSFNRASPVTTALKERLSQDLPTHQLN